MNKLKYIIKMYLSSVGAASVISSVFCVFIRGIDWAVFMQAVVVAFIIPNVVFVLTERHDVSLTEIWLRRILAFLTYPICLDFFMIAFGLIGNTERFLLIGAVMLIPEVILFVVSVLITESIQKRNLNKINKKLSENIN